MEREMEAPGFWDDPERSNQKMKELKNLKDTVGECDKLSTQYDDILTLIDMGYEENDESLIPERPHSRQLSERSVRSWMNSSGNSTNLGSVLYCPENMIRTMRS